MSLTAILLAAGEGKRMKSATSKVLHHAAGYPLIHYPLAAALEAGCTQVVLVVNANNESALRQYVGAAFPDLKCTTALQPVALGTGDAARIGLASAGSHADEILILCGDTPLIRGRDLKRLRDESRTAHFAVAFLSCLVADPTGYGRVLRDQSRRVRCIREERDLKTPEERQVEEVNAGVYLAKRAFLEVALSRLDAANAQGEFYLTDIVEQADPSATVDGILGDAAALLGVNDREQLGRVERLLYARIAEEHQRAGVTIHGRPSIDASVTLEADSHVGDNVHLRGRTVVRQGAHIDVGSVVTDSEIGAHAVVKPYTVVTGSRVGPRVQLGPFAHLRPGSELDEEARVGNFVEIKQTRLRKGAKANHLAYLGDGDVGERSNIGAGTIFCNYDGFTKARTVIAEDVFIGSDSQIVAPVTIGRGAYVATGTSVTEDVPADSLAISRGRQVVKPGYAVQLRERLAKKAD